MGYLVSPHGNVPAAGGVNYRDDDGCRSAEISSPSDIGIGFLATAEQYIP
jgi:hypothetical protein